MKKLLSVVQQVPAFKFVWAAMRERKIFREHTKVTDFWRKVIQLYFENKIEKHTLSPKKEFIYDKVIWQYWGQGLDEKNLPEVVKICFDSVEKYKGEHQIIRLTDDSIKEYLDLPDFVLKKRQNPKFKTVYFSDLLRVALLQVYGGIWLDATILLTGEIPKLYGELDYFVFQRDVQARYKSQWKNSYAYYWNWHPKFRVNVLNSMFFAKKDCVVVATLLDLMLYYWKTQDEVINYFFFQILYDELMNNGLASYRCPLVDDTLPHLFQTKINGGLKQVSLSEILESQTMHKLTYFKEDEIARLRKVIDIL